MGQDYMFRLRVSKASRCVAYVNIMLMVVIILSILLMASAWLAVLHGVRLYRSIRRSRLTRDLPASKELPSVSICIPARNEMHAMAECLEQVLASDYSKIEILVFDDSSEDGTSNIIRSFAQAGVRFVAGNELPEGWLGKNHALDVLAKEASGTYVLFMDVDTIIAPSTVRRLVDSMIHGKKTMLSVIPERGDGWRLSVLFGHLRYFWELSVNTPAHPGAASALWMINRKILLEDLGGVSAFRATAAPEAAIAAQLGPEKYKCIVSGPESEVMYEKKWLSQAETSKRLLYPRAHGTRLGAVIALGSLLLLNLPTFVLISGFITGWSSLHLIAGLALFAGMMVYGIFTHSLWQHVWWAGILVWPVVIFQELIFFINSLQGYYRRTITWKGRPVSPFPRPLPSK